MEGLWLLILIVVYLIPTIIGVYRNKPSKYGIFAFNVFFGWTIICWFIGIVWALS